MIKTFLGTGNLGTGFIKAALKRGEQVQVWNRTYDKAVPLGQFGANVFKDLIDAVNSASLIHLTLKDDETVETVLKLAIPGLTKGCIIIDHSTLSPANVIERTNQLKAQGYIYLHAPVFMGPQNAMDGTGCMCISGNQQAILQVLPELEKMTARVINFGEEVGKAAAIKLLGNYLLFTLTTGLADLVTLGRGMKLTTDDMTCLFDSWNPGTTIPTRFARITKGNFDHAQWTLNSARKDANLITKAAEDASALTLLAAMLQLMDQRIADGFGGFDWTVIGAKKLTEIITNN